MGETILVVGGAGYVGSHAAKALAVSGYQPVVVDNLSTGNRWSVKWGPLELADMHRPDQLADIFRHYRPAGVMHFAADALVGESMRHPARYYRNNVLGTLNLLDACRAADCRNLIFSSTCAVYGTPETMPITEDTPKDPVNPYGASKLMVERMLADHAMAYGLRHAVLRYFNAAGADPEGEIGESRLVETHLIPLAIDAVLGRRPPLCILGSDFPTADGTAIRDYVHVSDLAIAHVRALDQLIAGSGSFTLNLGSGVGHSVREVVDCLARVSGRDVPHTVGGRRPGDPPVLVADVTAARRHLGLGFEASLDRIVETAWNWSSRP